MSDQTHEQESRNDHGNTVCLTFDFDAFSLWMSRGLVTPGPLSRGEFGAKAVPRLLKMLESRGIETTWFVPGHTVETYPDLCGAVVDSGHEIALHGWNHEVVSTLDPSQERDVLRRAFDSLVRVTGVEPVGNRTPSWDYTEHTLDCLIDLGLLYDSSLMASDYTPYVTRRGDICIPDFPFIFGEPTSVVQLPVSWTLDDYPMFEYLRTPNYVLPGLRTPDDVFGNFFGDISYMVREESDGVCVLTFHPQVIGRGHRLLGLERFLDEVAELPVEFRRCDVVARRFREANSGRSPV